MDHIRSTEASSGTLLCLVYAAMTRAKYRLGIPYAEETELLAHMRSCLSI